MTGRIAIALMAVGLTGIETAAAGQSRLETEFARQAPLLTTYEGPTREESCGGTWLRVSMSGSEIRKLVWGVEMSQRSIRREFYLSRGSPQLVIETSWWKLDDNAYPLKTPRLEYARRYWLRDRSAGRAGMPVRTEMLEHAESLIKEFHASRSEYAKVRT